MISLLEVARLFGVIAICYFGVWAAGMAIQRVRTGTWNGKKE